MKQIKPIYLVLGASGIITSVVLLLSLLVNLFLFDIPLWYTLLFSLLMGIISFVVFYFFVKQFIRNRLKVLYRSIRKGSDDLNKNLEAGLTSNAIELAEQEAKKWTEERNREISKLKEQEEFRREFLGNLAHELKTPVFSIQGYILTLLEGGLEDSSVNRIFLERAEKATDRIANILEDLDQITKLEVDGIKMAIRPIDIVELTKEVFHELEIISKEKNITLKLEKDYNPIIVNADRVKIGQVLTNLIKNSINYGTLNGYTLIRFFSFDDIVTIEVEDNGPGIDEKEIPRLFERFYRVEKSRNRNEGGSGLGLAIVRNIVEAHKQTISVRSVVGKGSTFSFSLDKAKTSGELFSSRGIPIK